MWAEIHMNNVGINSIGSLVDRFPLIQKGQ